MYMAFCVGVSGNKRLPYVVCYVQLSQFHQMFLIVWFLQKGSQYQSCLQPKDELPPHHIISTLGGFVWDQSSSDVAMLYKNNRHTNWTSKKQKSKKT